MKCPNLHCLHTLEGSPGACPACGLPLPGAMLGERFKLEGVESATLTAVRFTARDGASKAAVRVLLPARGQEHATLAMQRDIEAVKDLGSGNMPRVLHHDFTGPLPWIASDAIAWERAERHVEAMGRPLGEKELLRFLEDAGKTIAPLHERGLAHRGIRSEAVYLKDSSGQIALGLPAWEADLDGRSPDLFKSPYEAPEYVPGRATPRTDMYALGVAALRLHTGLRGPSLAAAARNPAAHKDRFGLTKGTFDLLCALLAENTAKRVASGGQLLDLLAKLDPSHSFGPGPGAGGAGGGLRSAAGGAAAGVPIEAAGHQSGQLRDHEPDQGERPGQKDSAAEDRRSRSGWAALLALFLLLPALARRVLERAATQPGFQIKLLVAMGLSAAAVGAGGLVASRQVAADSLRKSPIPHALPSAIVGRDDGAAPVAPDASLWAKVMALLPAPAPATRALEALPSGGRQDADGPGGPAPGALEALPRGGRQDAGGPGGPAPGALEALPRGGRQDAGGPGGPAPGALATPGGGRQDAGNPGGRTPDGPYDPVAEPGTDPEDASGLTRQSRFFIRVNKTYKTLTLYRDGQYVTQYVVAIGKGANTPDGRFTVKKKLANPSYENIPPLDGRNPLGTRWLGMDVRYPGGRSIGIHGTNDDPSIGQAVSGGCIRMKNADAEQLYDLVPEGTPVEIN